MISSTKAQHDFINSVVHELRNPLNAIVGLADILKNEGIYQISCKEREEYLRDISESARELNDMINDLLDIGSINSGSFSINLNNKVDIKDLVRRIVKLNFDLALKRKITLKSQVADDVEVIKLDAKRMKQILANLISNSIKYSPQNTEVTISAKNIVKDKRKFLQIIVADQGFGMTADQVTRAFQMYQTIQNPNSGTVDSFGLGLPIVKHLVEAQNGDIEVKSEPNKGTEVVLRFPA